MQQFYTKLLGHIVIINHIAIIVALSELTFSELWTESVPLTEHSVPRQTPLPPSAVVQGVPGTAQGTTRILDGWSSA